MAKTKALPVPRIEVTRSKKNKKYYYRVIGKNRQVLIDCKQGFDRQRGLLNNIVRVAETFAPESFPVSIHRTTEGTGAKYFLSVKAPEWIKVIKVYFV